jgi:sodium transport system permease protein
MNLNLFTVRTLFCTEMRMVLRDRRMLITSILLPLLVTPLMFLGSSWSLKKRDRTLQQMTYKYAVTGSNAAMVRTLLTATRERLAGAEKAKGKAASFNFEEVECEDALPALTKGEVHLVIEGLIADEAGAQKDARTPAATGKDASARPRSEAEDGEPRLAGAPVVRLVYRADRDESGAASSRMHDMLSETRDAQRAKLLKARQFPVNPAEVGVVTEIDVASAGQVAGLALGRVLTLLLLLFILTGGAIVATDSLAGEKERGTLETLLTTAANRTEILAAKHLVVLAVALLITLIQTANLLVYVSFKLLPMPPNLAAAAPPQVVLLLFVVFLPVAALAANILLLISGYARSYKEAQMYFLPAMLLGFLPALAPLLPGLSLRSAVVLVPIANLALAAKDILAGIFDWPMIVLSWLATAGAAVWTTRMGVRFLSAEKLITAADSDAVEFAGGAALFERRVLRWFALLWATLLLVSNYTAKADLRLQVVINLVGLFFGASVLMLRRYRLDPRVVLALRAPKPVVWLGTLFAVPGGLLVALGMFRLSNLFMPVSTKVTESFSESVLPPDISPAQLLFFLAVMPAVFEEIAFRGLLLHGLRRRLHPAALAVVVGVVFGIFHVALFRFVPTACLGVMLAAVTMLTGSIYPAMLWHCLNNAAGLLASRLQLPETGLGPVCYLAGAGMLAAAFWIFWRNRTPYPGLRPWRS